MEEWEKTPPELRRRIKDPFFTEEVEEDLIFADEDWSGDDEELSYITGDPVEEVKIAQRILSSLELRRFNTNVIACPSCGRCEIDVVGVAQQVERRLSDLASKEPKVRNLTVAVMGCVVNGPGESEHADVGMAGGGGVGVIYRKGKQVRRVTEAEMVNALIAEVKSVVEEQSRESAALLKENG